MTLAARLLLVLLVLLTVLPLGALEVSRGRIRIITDPRRGTVILSVADSLDNPRWVPLTWSRDPATTFMTLRVDGQILDLLPGNHFRLNVQEEPNGLAMNYSGNRVNATVRYEFLTSRFSSIADGVRITVEVTNRTDKPLSWDLRYLIDTYLGEGGGHFLVDNVWQSREFRLLGRAATSWISARNESDPQVGLLFWLGEGVTAPNRTVFANWKRLRDSPWDHVFSEGREFSQPPYSFNDSAVAVFYEGLSLQPGSSQAVVMAIANVSARDLLGARIGTESVFGDVFESTVRAPQQERDLLRLLRRDRETLLDLLRRINQGIASPSNVSPEQIAAMRAILQELESRKSLFP